MNNKTKVVTKINRLEDKVNDQWTTYNIGAEATNVYGRNGDRGRHTAQSLLLKDMPPVKYTYGQDIYNASDNTFEPLTWESIQRWLDNKQISEFLKEGDCIEVQYFPGVWGYFWIIGINRHNGQSGKELDQNLDHIDFCGGSFRHFSSTHKGTFFQVDHNNGSEQNNGIAFGHFWQQAGQKNNKNFFDFIKIPFLNGSGLGYVNSDGVVEWTYIKPKTLYLGARYAQTPVFDSIATNIFYADFISTETSTEQSLDNFVSFLGSINEKVQTAIDTDLLSNVGTDTIVNYQKSLILELLIRMSFNLETYIESYIENARDSNHPTIVYDYYGVQSSAAAFDVLRYSVGLIKDSVLDGVSQYYAVTSHWALSLLRYRLLAFLPILSSSSDRVGLKERENGLNIIFSSELETAINEAIAAQTSSSYIDKLNQAKQIAKKLRYEHLLDNTFISFLDEDGKSSVLRWIKEVAMDSTRSPITTAENKVLINETLDILCDLCDYFNKTGATRTTPYSTEVIKLPVNEEDTSTYLWGLTEQELFGHNAFGDPLFEQGQLFQYPILADPAMRRKICHDLVKDTNSESLHMATLTAVKGSSYQVAGMDSETLMPETLDIVHSRLQDPNDENSDVINPIDMPICFRMQQNAEDTTDIIADDSGLM